MVPFGTLGVHGIRYGQGNLHLTSLGVHPGDFLADLLGEPQIAIRPEEHVMGVCQPGRDNALFKAFRDWNRRPRLRWAIGQSGHRHTGQVGSEQQGPRPGQRTTCAELFFKFPMVEFHAAPSGSLARKQKNSMPSNR
ncbi:hypothetical protein D3C76_1081410 [compost metagenome]